VSRAKDELTEAAQQRLDAMVATTDGFELAERDLDIRGEGELLGTRQSGAFGLRFASLRGDRDLLELARAEAADLVEGEHLLVETVAARAAAAAA
jgi:ATP-dependent DNA helicase RecG